MSLKQNLTYTLIVAVAVGSAVAGLEAQQPAAPAAPVATESNVVYGMHGGLALLLDVYRPPQPNGHGVLLLQGSGFHAPSMYGAPGMKNAPNARNTAARLAAAGYTVFAVNHRTAPVFRHPAAFEDVQRAVRFVRSKAA